eukprot:TRINITY_DN1052_c0_g2_i1.p1 TRINITY_DN1052_c0_g2~~TRINITY_DN1052_c0_g2_i1.p1  ORF type:complete len:715 (+),score=169.48 TRINITY_DN1052_c0_g2_i1:223-2145(+)
MVVDAPPTPTPPQPQPQPQPPPPPTPPPPSTPPPIKVNRHYERDCKTPPLPTDPLPDESIAELESLQRKLADSVCVPPVQMVDTSEIDDSNCETLPPECEIRASTKPPFMDLSEIELRESDLVMQEAVRRHAQRDPPPPPPPVRVSQIDGNGAHDNIKVVEPIRVLPVPSVGSEGVFKTAPTNGVGLHTTPVFDNKFVEEIHQNRSESEASTVPLECSTVRSRTMLDIGNLEMTGGGDLSGVTSEGSKSVKSVSFNPVIVEPKGNGKWSFNDSEDDFSCPLPTLPSRQSLTRNRRSLAILLSVCLVVVFCIIFSIIVLVALGRDTPIDARCEGLHHYPYKLVSKTSIIESTGRFSMNLHDLRSLSFLQGTTFVATSSNVFDFEEGGLIIGLQLDQSGNPVHVDLPQIAADVKLSQPTGITTSENGGIWVADRASHTLRQVSDATTKVTLGGFGVHGGGNLSKTEFFPTNRLLFGNGDLRLAAGGDLVKVLDSKECRVQVFSNLGRLITSFGSCDELASGVSVATADRTTYVATNDGIVVFDDILQKDVATYPLNVPSTLLDSFRFTLLRQPWRGRLSSLSFTPTGHLLTTEGSRVQIRNVEGSNLCAFGDLTDPVSAIMLPDLRIVVAEKDHLLVFAVSS